MRLAIIASALLAAVPLSAQEEGSAQTVVTREEHDVVRADTLWDLAERFYKDPWQWPRIYEANKDQIRDPHWIYPDQILIIPGFDRAVRVIKRDAPEPVPSAPPPAPEPEPEAAPVPFQPNRAPGAIALPESLSTRLPKGMTEGQPSAYRLLMPKGWQAQGRVVRQGGMDTLAAQGEDVRVRLDAAAPVRRGTRFTVWRLAAPTEADPDQKATYTQKVGVLEAVKRVAKTEYRARVLRSGGPVQVGDLVTIGE